LINMEPKNKIPLFFIIGRPRSGTTLLRLLFESHPNVIIPPESPVILGLYRKYKKIKNWEENDILEFINDLYSQRYFDVWLWDRQELTEKLLECKGENTFDDLVRKLYMNYPTVFTKKEILLIGDKNPGYALYIKSLHKLYPQSKFIFINRDYRDNYVSLTRVNFEVPIVALVIFRWKFVYKQYLKLRKKDPEHFYYIKYEDLAKEPQSEFKKLCRFVDIEYDESVFNFYEKKKELEKMYGHDQTLLNIHKNLFKPINQSSFRRWESEMSDKQVKEADHVAGKYADKAGYRRKYTMSNLWYSIKFAPLLMYANLMYQLMLAGEKLPFRIRNALLKVLGVFLKFYWSFNQGKMKDK